MLQVKRPIRFIPAPAGNSRFFDRWRVDDPVHPRACGEQLSEIEAHGLTLGSSPRLRGTEVVEDVVDRGHRFIPAPAGNSASAVRASACTAVHPRACGEQFLIINSSPWSHGSSPRLRGTARAPRLLESCLRFIPAPAGNSSLEPDNNRRTPVHPRACGEQLDGISETDLNSGSSPRLRGTAFGVAAATAFRRFIPAPAGNRTTAAGPIGILPVHPRACGEQPFRGCGMRENPGSSPRLRGTAQRGRHQAGGLRFIPAPAGNRPQPGR